MLIGANYDFKVRGVDHLNNNTAVLYTGDKCDSNDINNMIIDVLTKRYPGEEFQKIINSSKDIVIKILEQYNEQ